MAVFKPSGPYVINTGKHKGQVLELLMFTNYTWLVWMLNFLNKGKPATKNSFHLHLEWLLEQGENRQPTLTCRFCGERPVTLLSIYRSHSGQVSIGTFYTCCENEKCQAKLRGLAAGKPVELAKLRFSTARKFSLKADQALFANTILREVFCLPARLTRDRAFQFFSQ